MKFARPQAHGAQRHADKPAGGLIVTYPIPRVDRHEPLNALVVLVLVVSAAALVALIQ